MGRLRVLVACEFSGIVRDAFAAKGHDAWSCDLLPTERPGQHLQEDALWCAYNRQWDLMIAHPPCTYLSTVGEQWFKTKPGRMTQRRDALWFLKGLYNSPVPKVCIENPQGNANTHFRKPDQVVHPWYWGDSEMKRTCLWLRGLPRLVHYEDDLFEKRTHAPKPEPKWVNKGTGKRVHWTAALVRLPLAERAKARSKSFPGIARAMADQWG